MKAPSFSLPDQDGITHTMDEYRGSWLVVYFYPRDDTPGCTTEACSFRDMSAEFKKQGIQVIGISKDTISSHKKFSEKYNLPFTILSDPTTSTIKAFGSWGQKKFMGRLFDGILRKTYIINPEGEIVKTYDKVTPLGHGEALLADIALLKKN